VYKRERLFPRVHDRERGAADLIAVLEEVDAEPLGGPQVRKRVQCR